MKISRNGIVMRIAMLVLAFVVMTTFAPSFAWQNAYAYEEVSATEQLSDEAVVQVEETSPEESAEDARESVELSLDDLKPAGSEAVILANVLTETNGLYNYTVQPSSAVAGVGDRYKASCVTDFDVTGRVIVQQSVFNRASNSYIWAEKAAINTDYKAGETIVVGQLHDTDRYGNKSQEPSTQVYRFAIEVANGMVYSNEFTIQWAYPIVKTQISEIDYPIIGKSVDKQVVVTSTYLDADNNEHTTTDAAKVSNVTWYEFPLIGTSEGAAFNGTYSVGHTYSVSVHLKPSDNYYFPEGSAYSESYSQFNKYEHNGKECEGKILGISIQRAGVSNMAQAGLSKGDLRIDSNTASGKRITPITGKDAYRIAGDTRYDTALKIADEQKLSVAKFDNVVLAYGKNYPDALAGSFLAINKKAPILLIEDSKSVKNKVLNYIYENVRSTGTIYILGGTTAIPSSIQNTLKNKGYNVVRLGGSTRYETNMKILKSSSMSGMPVIVSSGTGYADSLSASSTGYPIMIIDPAKGISDEQISFLKSQGSNKFYVIGGELALPKSVDRKLSKLGSVKRVAGDTRYATSKLVAEEFSQEGKIHNVVIAYGKNFPDGLCAGPLAAHKNASLILTENSSRALAREYVDNHVIMNGYVTGGPKLISDDSVKYIMTADSVKTK